MKRAHQFIILILGLLSTAAWAAPRIAIVQVLSGEAKLAGQPLTVAQMAEEGQVLAVSAKSQVRVQLLGSSKETVIKGPVDYTLAKATLSKQGKAVRRGSVAVKEEIGNLNRGAVAPQRGYKTLGLVLELPPIITETGSVLRSTTTQHSSKNKSKVYVTVMDLTEAQIFQEETPYDQPIPDLVFDKPFQIGHRYEIIIQEDNAAIKRTFRILAPEETAGLEETAAHLRREAIESREIAPLLRLAGLYKSFDQTEKVAATLMQTVKAPAFEKLDESIQKRILANLNEARKSLDMEQYPADNG